jgi:phenylalanyl-tRNA synthetase beta chain
MKISYNWIKELTDMALSPVELADFLTMAGHEVETLHDLSESLQPFVVGEVVEYAKVPESEHLTHCKVNDGEQVWEVICGAPNHKQGDKICFISPGKRLPDGTKIKKAKIRGIVSYGMICSDKEMGISEEAEGVHILPPDAALGQPAANYLGRNDTILELEITPNRPDVLSHIGMARELRFSAGMKIKFPQTQPNEDERPASDAFKVRVDNKERCPRYMARVIENVKVGPSPDWVQNRLESCGIRSINNVVDATNYALMEYGQPLHGFDLDTLHGDSIIVRSADEGEVMITLDGEKRTLSADDLVIADCEEAIALAGVMGGHRSEVSDKTTRVILESAYFESTGIRRTSKLLGLSTEASYRFERGMDFDNVPIALDRCARLIAEWSGGSVLAGRLDDTAPEDMRPMEARRRTIKLRVSRVNKLLGVKLSLEKLMEILQRLPDNLNTHPVVVSPEDDDLIIIMVAIPAARVDLFREVDLIEEIARIIGYSKIPSTVPQFSAESMAAHSSFEFERNIKEILVACGLNEVITYSFIGDSDMNALAIPEDSDLRDTLRLSNPLSEEMSQMRTTLLPSLWNAVCGNERQGNSSFASFEVARLYLPDAGPDALHCEKRVVSACLRGQVRNHWGLTERKWDYFDAKGLVEHIAHKCGLPALTFKPEDKPYLFPGHSAAVYCGDEPLGVVGELHPVVTEKTGITETVAVFEIDVETLALLSGTGKKKFETVSGYPSVSRDIALVAPQGLNSCAITDMITQSAGKLLEDLELFDEYHGGQLQEGQRSLAYRMVLRSHDTTLTDEKANSVMGKITRRLEKELKVTVREA